MIKIYNMDVMKALRKMPDESVDMQICSPPYWGLRDYGEGTESIWEIKGEIGCEHKFEKHIDKKHGGTSNPEWEKDMSRGIRGQAEWIVESGFCTKCGAWKGQLGLEPDFNLYIKHMIQIFDEVKRVLKKDGTCWVNLGDTYSSSGKGKGTTEENLNKIAKKGDGVFKRLYQRNSNNLTTEIKNDYDYGNLQPKCLTAIPERFMLAMIDSGWILRNKIIWHKPNHMPTSVKDRFANSWEYLYFFSKSKKYYFDLDAVREPHKWADKDKRSEQIRVQHKSGKSKLPEFQGGFNGVGYNPKGKNPDDVLVTPHHPKGDENRGMRLPPQANQPNAFHELGKNPADFWNITTQPYKEAHFAVFPERLVERPIKTTPKEICNKCGKARERIVEIIKEATRPGLTTKYENIETKWSPGNRPCMRKREIIKDIKTKGWTTCSCKAGFHPALILDIFAGSGTTLKVARDLGRDSIGIEIKPDYCQLIKKRLFNGNEPLFPDEFKIIKPKDLNTMSV